MGSSVWVLPLLTFILGFFVILPIIIIVKWKMSNLMKKIDVIENAPLIDVDKSRRRFTNGYTKGIVKKISSCKNGTTRIEFYPLDYEQGENKPIPALQSFLVNNEFYKPLAPGDDSDHRTIIKTITRFPTDIPKKIRETQEGIEMAKEGQKAYLEKTFGDWVRAGDEAIHEAMLESSRIGIAKSALARLKEDIKILKRSEIQLKQESEEKNKNF